MSRFLPADHSKGDEGTIGGYAAVHARPAALEGQDGFSYSVEILADAVPEGFGAFFLFVRWKKFGAQGVADHLESGFLTTASDRESAKRALGATRVEDVQRRLDALIAERDAKPAERE